MGKTWHWSDAAKLRSRRIILQHCEECGKEFNKIPASHQRFCSLSCSTTHNNAKRGRYNLVRMACDCCGKEIFRLPCELRNSEAKGMKRHYCSRQCAGKDKKGSKRPATSKAVRLAYAEGRLSQPLYKGGGFRKDLGIYVRSCWEANVARILTHMERKWQYESETFIITADDKIITYTPDFYLPIENKFVEVKGFWHSKAEYDKFKFFEMILDIELIDKENYMNLKEKYVNAVKWEYTYHHYMLDRNQS